MNERDVARFESWVDSNGPVPAHCPELGPCHVWTGKPNSTGYGCIGLDGKVIKAYQFAWIREHGPIPKGAGYHGNCVMHLCDNPLCVRVSHLKLGTHAENMRDMAEKRRVCTKPKNVKLSPEQREQVMRLRADGWSLESIGAEVGVHQTTVGRFVRGATWRGA